MWFGPGSQETCLGKQNLKECVQDSRNEHLFPMKSFHVRLVDDNVSAIYESSRFATSDLKEHPRLVRRAVALGRACIEPLTVLCTLMASSPAELLALQLHPLQVRRRNTLSPVP